MGMFERTGYIKLLAECLFIKGYTTIFALQCFEYIQATIAPCAEQASKAFGRRIEFLPMRICVIDRK
jgi:hypothetical protein